jgi:lysophospholipase L1-like esterase
MRRVRSLLGSAVLSLVAFFAAGEILSRVYHVVDRLNGFPRRLYVATDDPSPAYRLRPGIETTVRGIAVRVNELGLRGPEVSAVPTPGVRRVLALGDSATFGEGLPEEDAFPRQLERELRTRTGERWEVLNAGVQGYNTADELGFLVTRGLDLAPESVVVGFNLNDFDYGPVINSLGVLTRDRAARAGRWSLGNLSEFYLVLRWLAVMRQNAFVRWSADDVPPDAPAKKGFSDFDRAVSTMRKRYYEKPNDDRWQAMVDALQGLGRVARERGLRLVVAIIPDGDQLEAPEPAPLPQQKILAICAEAKLECVDLHPAFVAAGATGLHLDIMHPNAAGQRVVARVLAERLARPGAGSAPAAMRLLHVPERP